MNDRLDVVLLVVMGFYAEESLPEVDQVPYASRIYSSYFDAQRSLRRLVSGRHVSASHLRAAWNSGGGQTSRRFRHRSFRPQARGNTGDPRVAR
jgi:hypothetical protein